MEMLIIGMKGRVLGIDKRSGQQVWETRLKGAGFVNLSVDADQVYAATRGELYCLEPRSGQVLWHNPMKGLGYGMVCFGFDSSNQAAHVAQIIAQQRQAAAGGAGGASAAG